VPASNLPPVTPRTAPGAPAGRSVMTKGMVLLFAVACGVSAGNLYYAQPLLPQIARSFHAGAGETTLVVTAAQVGYGCGLALLVPLGDVLVRRRFVPGLLVLAAVALLAAAASPNIVVLIAAVAVAGVCSVAAQVLVPFSATLADDDQRGRVVGTVMSGLLVGILLARTLSGLIADAAGWRTVFVVAAGVVLAMAVLLHHRLPGEPARPHLDYADLLGSVVHLLVTEPVLRLRAAIGALAFATFNVIWTSLAFLLVGPPYHFTEATVGLFGLLGAAGALAATFSGRLADRGLEQWVSGTSLALTVASFGLLALGRHDLWALMVGILLADLGIQAVHIQNQQLIFAIDPEARSRLNTGYMVLYFVGGALGSASVGAAYAAGGWSAVVVLGAVYAGSAMALWVLSEATGIGHAGRRRLPRSSHA
jgi:predicted MFS family arabinose efflux permease